MADHVRQVRRPSYLLLALPVLTEVPTLAQARHARGGRGGGARGRASGRSRRRHNPLLIYCRNLVVAGKVLAPRRRRGSPELWKVRGLFEVKVFCIVVNGYCMTVYVHEQYLWVKKKAVVYNLFHNWVL